MYAVVTFARPLKNLTYKIPKDFETAVNRGMRVVAPLGRRLEVGWVLEVKEKTELNPRIIKSIKAVVDKSCLYTPEIIKLLSWASDYYITPPGYFFKAATPAGLSGTPEFMVTLSEGGRKYRENLKLGKKPTLAQRVLQSVPEEKSIDIKNLEKSSAVENTLQKCYALEKEGYINLEQELKVREDYLLRKHAVILNERHRHDVSEVMPELKRAKAQKMIVEYMQGREEPVTISDLTSNLNVSNGPVDELLKKKILSRRIIIIERDNLYPEYIGALRSGPELTEEQNAAYEKIIGSVEHKEFKTYLLHGVTGSGKTEVYVKLCFDVIKRGKSALVLIPEISLTPQLFRRFQEFFGARLALLHSGLPAGERFEQWLKVKKGEADVVLGTRSAVFAPISKPGIVIVDEEHDGSYKQDDTPRYNARDLAIMRAKMAGVPAVLGSATPSVETYFNAVNGKYELIEMTRRYGNQKMPDVRIIDMRKEFEESGFQQEVSYELDKAVKARLERGEQALVLINRRGYRSRLICKECGRIVLCKHCNVAMKFHKNTDNMVCHFCDFRKPVADNCEYCFGELIEFVGIGTQRIEEIFQKDFPKARVIRMDHDTTRAKGGHYDILELVKTGQADILVGTQMVAKGHDYPGITLVGVISAESILALPDFRHSEKTFQLLTQVAGRAGRGETPGEVVIQAFAPDHFSINYARTHDYKSFYSKEIFLREKMAYPPFTRMALVRFEGEDRSKLYEKANRFKKLLQRHAEESILIRGPKSAPLSKLRGRFRLQLILRSPSGKGLNRTLRTINSLLEEKGNDIALSTGDYIVDIDPYNLM